MNINKTVTTNNISLHRRSFLVTTLLTLIAVLLLVAESSHVNWFRNPPPLSGSPAAEPQTAIMSKNTDEDFVLCEDMKKPNGAISTGIGFLDHMIDQLNSHAQIGVTLLIASFDDDSSPTPAAAAVKEDKKNRNADKDQGKLMSLVGTKLGTELKRLLVAKSVAGESRSSSRFCCPLDEALVECVLVRQTTDDGYYGNLETFTLPPYGKFPRNNGTGRKRIGKMDTASFRLFWESLAKHSGLLISLDKIRGDNAHHIVESAFKAFSRALRNLLDGTDTTTLIENKPLEVLYGPDSSNWKQSIALNRKGVVERKTNETSISATLHFDGGTNGIAVNTGIQTLDEFFITLAQSASMSLNLQCQGDLWIDEHHTAEDVAIAFGQVLSQALGTKAGLNRMWCATAVEVEGEDGDNSSSSKVEVTMDLSNRPCLVQNLSFDNNDGDGDEMIGDLSIEMFEHVLDSIVVNSRMTCHVVESGSGNNANSNSNKNTVQAVAKAFGSALKYCSVVDSRRCGATASSKGTLSV